MNPFVHALVIERVTYDESVQDAQGQPTASAPILTEVEGLVQPRRADELNDSRSAGAELSDHVIFLPDGTDLAGSDSILFGDRRYEVKGIRRFEFGGLPHLEVDATLVTTVAVGAAGS